MTLPSSSRVQRYLSIALRLAVVTVVVFFVTLSAGKYIIDHFVPKVYAATAEIELTEHIVSISKPASPAYVAALDANSSATAQIEKIMSPDILVPVIYDLGLERTWAKLSSDGNPLVLSESDALIRLGSIISAKPKRGQQAIRISATSSDPKEAADIANAVAYSYLASRETEAKANYDHGIDSLKKQIAFQEQKVQQATATLSKLTNPDSTDRLDAEHQLANEKSLLEALKVRLSADLTSSTKQKNPVEIVSNASIPKEQVSPSPRLCFIVTAVVAVGLSVLIGCFVEVILLLVRASSEPET